MKKIIALLAIALSTGLVGCSGINVEKEPSLTNLKWSNGKKVYMKTLYVQSDFKTDGSKRNFYEYDFTKESAPCTVLREYSPRNYLYTVGEKEDTLTFECRPYYGYELPNERRLYLLGSVKDCQDRTWDYKAPVLNSFESTLNMCNLPKRTLQNDTIESRYRAWFNKKSF